MPTKTTFKVAIWRETHYELEIEASSYKEAERKAYNAVWNRGSGDIDEYQEGELVCISDTECLDPHWDEEFGSEELATARKAAAGHFLSSTS